MLIAAAVGVVPGIMGVVPGLMEATKDMSYYSVNTVGNAIRVR